MKSIIAKVRHHWPLFLLAALVLVFFWNLFFAGEVLCMRDTFSEFIPFRLFTHQAFSAGRLPLWNPYSNCGQPFMADPQTSILYPLHICFYLLPAGWAFNISLALHLFLLAVSMYALLRYWGVKQASATLSAVALVFSTYNIANLEFMSAHNVLSWSPLTLLLVSRIVDKSRLPRGDMKWKDRIWKLLPLTVVLGIVLALQIMAGNPQPLQFTLLMGGILLILKYLEYRNWRAILTSSGACVVAGLLALALCFPQLLLTMQLMPHSLRAGGIDPGLNMASTHPLHFLTLFLPFLFGRPGYPDTYWGITIFEFWAGACYIGCVPLILASFSSFSFRRRKQKERTPNQLFPLVICFCFVVLVIGLLLAAGKYTPLYMFLVNHLPGMHSLRWPSKSLQMVIFSLAILTGLGLDNVLAWRRGKRTPRMAFVLIAAWGVVSLIVFAGYLFGRKDPSVFSFLTGGQFHPENRHYELLLRDYGYSALFLAIAVLIVFLLIMQKIPLRVALSLVLAVSFFNLYIVGRQLHFMTKNDIYEQTPLSLQQRPIDPSPYRVHSPYARMNQWFYGSKDRGLFEWHKAAIVKESTLPLHVFKASGTENLALKRYMQVITLFPRLQPAQGSRLADIMNLKYVIQGSNPDDVLFGKASRQVSWHKRTRALPRAFLVSDWKIASNLEQAVNILLSAGFNPQRSAVLQAPCPRPLPQDWTLDEAGESAGDVASVEYDWNCVQVKCQAFRPALLVLSDAWYPGWKVLVDGQSAQLYQANALFRGVLLPVGTHSVRFEYHPPCFSFALIISIATLIFMLALLFWAFWRRGRSVLASRGTSSQ